MTARAEWRPYAGNADSHVILVELVGGPDNDYALGRLQCVIISPGYFGTRGHPTWLRPDDLRPLDDEAAVLIAAGLLTWNALGP